MAGWPTSAELQTFLLGAGLVSEPPSTAQLVLDYQGAIDSAIEQWNDMTHYWPFMSTGNVNEARKFQPTRSGLLDFNGGLITLTAIVTEVQYTNNVSDGGSARVQSTDYFLRPENASQRKKPWTYLDAGWYQGWGFRSGYQDSIIITGEWGYSNAANLPASAKGAVLALAAIWLLPQLLSVLTRGGLTSLQQGDSKKTWDHKQFTDTWQSVVDRSLAQGFVRPRIA